MSRRSTFPYSNLRLVITTRSRREHRPDSPRSGVAPPTEPQPSSSQTQPQPTTQNTPIIRHAYLHPAPLPPAEQYPVSNVCGLVPPAPVLVVKKNQAEGKVRLLWNMPKIPWPTAKISCFEIYLYRTTGTERPNTSDWKRYKRIPAYDLCMAGKLQLDNSDQYYFAIRAIDIHSRAGPFSVPRRVMA